MLKESMSNVTKSLVNLCWLVGGIASIIGAEVFAAFVTTLAWAWFLSPLGPPVPSLVSMLGLRAGMRIMFSFAQSDWTGLQIDEFFVQHDLDPAMKNTARGLCSFAFSSIILGATALIRLF